MTDLMIFILTQMGTAAIASFSTQQQFCPTIKRKIAQEVTQRYSYSNNLKATFGAYKVKTWKTQRNKDKNALNCSSVAKGRAPFQYFAHGTSLFTSLYWLKGITSCADGNESYVVYTPIYE